MIIAEYTLDHPILRNTLHGVPGIEIVWEDTYTGPNGRVYMIAWFDCADFDLLDAALQEDETITEPTVLTEAGERRLYRFELVGRGAETSIMSTMVEAGGVHQELIGDGGGWHNRTRFPDRKALESVYHFCQSNDIGFTFNRIYELSDRVGSEAAVLSDAQYETLIQAVECGYLDIPRRSSLAELGDRLGISESAASERFRRGVKNLIQETVSR